MSAVNTVNTVDLEIAKYANDNAIADFCDSLVNDYNVSCAKSVSAVVRPKSLADLIGHATNDNAKW